MTLFQFGSLGVLSYAAVRDIQKQDKLNDLETRLKAIEDSDPSLTKTRITSVCEKVNAITSQAACSNNADTSTCKTTLDMVRPSLLEMLYLISYT